MSGFVHFYSRRGIGYAEWRVSVRQGDKVTHERRNLGRVIDRDRLIFKRRGGLPYGITSDGTPRDLTADELATIAARDDATVKATWGSEHDPLDFGDAFFVLAYLCQLGLQRVLEDLVEGRTSTALCLIVHQVLYPSGSLQSLAAWWTGSYACYRFPEVALDAQGIRACLEELGRADVRERLLGVSAELSTNEDVRPHDVWTGAVVTSPCEADADSPLAAGRKVLASLATAVRARLQRDLATRVPSWTGSDASVALMSLRNHKARTYDRAIVPCPPAPENAALYDAFEIAVPAAIPWEHKDPRISPGVGMILAVCLGE